MQDSAVRANEFPHTLEVGEIAPQRRRRNPELALQSDHAGLAPLLKQRGDLQLAFMSEHF
jgi:hypothetical protein